MGKSHVQNAKAQRDSYIKTLDKHTVRERHFDLAGTFKPLSVWATNGYDPQTIAEKSQPEDVMVSKMFGLVYRAPELTIGARGL